MDPLVLTRRTALLGAVSLLGGCSAISSLNAAARPLNTYDLMPVPGSKIGRRTSRTLLVARPEASAALAADRIMIRPDPVSVTYLPDARWSDELPLVVRSLLIRSISATGRVGYVGSSDAGPVPDKALLVRIDAFEVKAQNTGGFEVSVDMALTILNDRDQRVIASRRFAQSALADTDSAETLIAAFQNILNVLLPDMANWAIPHV